MKNRKKNIDIFQIITFESNVFNYFFLFFFPLFQLCTLTLHITYCTSNMYKCGKVFTSGM